MPAWTPPSYVTTGLASSAQHNVEVVDNLRHLYDRQQLVGAGAVCTSTGATTPSGTSVMIPWTTELTDTDDFHDPLTNPERFTIPPGYGGWYALSFTAAFDSNAAGVRVLGFRKNGGGDNNLMQVHASSSNGIRLNVGGEYDLVPGDYIEFYGRQTSGGSLDITSARGSLRLVAPL